MLEAVNDLKNEIADLGKQILTANTLWHQVNFEVLTLHKYYISAYVRLLLYSELDRSVYEWKIAEIMQLSVALFPAREC